LVQNKILANKVIIVTIISLLARIFNQSIRRFKTIMLRLLVVLSLFFIFGAVVNASPPNPTLISVTPDRFQEGETITLNGTGFGENPTGMAVAFSLGNSNVPRPIGEILKWTETQIKVVVPELNGPLQADLWTVFVTFQVDGNWVFSNDISIQPQSVPVVKIEEFIGASQYHEPEILNAGSLTLTIDFGSSHMSILDLDNGRMTFQNTDGLIGSIQNIWTKIGPYKYQWVQYIPHQVVRIWINTEKIVNWVGYGPFSPSDKVNGLEKEQKTQLSFSFVNPIYLAGEYDPLWDWTLEVKPDWAASQYSYQEYTIGFETTCNGKAGNHNGNFYWKGVTNGIIFGNWVPKQWVKQPDLITQYQIMSAGKWVVNGEIPAPSCWASINYVPLILN